MCDTSGKIWGSLPHGFTLAIPLGPDPGSQRGEAKFPLQYTALIFEMCLSPEEDSLKYKHTFAIDISSKYEWNCKAITAKISRGTKKQT